MRALHRPSIVRWKGSASTYVLPAAFYENHLEHVDSGTSMGASSRRDHAAAGSPGLSAPALNRRRAAAPDRAPAPERCEEIQSAAVEGKTDLGTILRKCKVLAARLGNQPLEQWVLWESNGYPAGIEVPDYRSWPFELKGHFSGAFGSALNYAPIPSVCVPEKYRKSWETFECRDSVVRLEETLKSDPIMLKVTTGNLSVLLGQKVDQGMNCIQAWGEFGSGQLVEALNVVRNRILDFSLAMWKEYPQAGELGQQTEKINPSHITQIFQTSVYGGSA